MKDAIVARDSLVECEPLNAGLILGCGRVWRTQDVVRNGSRD